MSFCQGKTLCWSEVLPTFYNLSTKEIGYLEELVNKSKVEDLTIKLAMTMAATDGHLDQKELNVIKNWAKRINVSL